MLEFPLYLVIAAFIISKLYHVLGKNSSVVTSKSIVVENQEIDEELEKYPQFKVTVGKIIKKNGDFSLMNFVNGSEKAFELIINLISKNEIKSLETLLNKDLYSKLKKEIDQRIEKSELHETTIVSIKSKEIQMIEVVKNNINISIKFISEKINLVRNIKTNEITRGNPAVTELAEDMWSFTKNIKSSNTRWLLVGV